MFSSVFECFRVFSSVLRLGKRLLLVQLLLFRLLATMVNVIDVSVCRC